MTLPALRQRRLRGIWFPITFVWWGATLTVVLQNASIHQDLFFDVNLYMVYFPEDAIRVVGKIGENYSCQNVYHCFKCSLSLANTLRSCRNLPVPFDMECKEPWASHHQNSRLGPALKNRTWNKKFKDKFIGFGHSLNRYVSSISSYVFKSTILF